jgi:lipoprotein signal peptidase
MIFKKWLNKLDLHYYWIVLFIFFNILISAIVRNNKIFFLLNENPVSYSFGFWPSVLGLVLVTFISFYAKLLQKSAVSTIFVLAGIYSNFLEILIFGGVADYISISIAYINLADLQIISGIVLLNLHVWFFTKNPNDKMSDNSIWTGIQ